VIAQRQVRRQRQIAQHEPAALLLVRAALGQIPGAHFAGHAFRRASSCTVQRSSALCSMAGVLIARTRAPAQHDHVA
jgi:hypothetical protein